MGLESVNYGRLNSHLFVSGFIMEIGSASGASRSPAFMVIASTEFWSVRGASYHPAFMGKCPTISYACWPI